MGFYAIRGKTGKEKVRGKEENPLTEILRLMPPTQPNRKVMEVTLFSLYVPIAEEEAASLFGRPKIFHVGAMTLVRTPFVVSKMLFMELRDAC